MTEETETILLPKIKKIDFLEKVILDPADFSKGLPKNKLPEIHEKGLILSLESKKVGKAKMTGDGALKLNILYTAQVLWLLGRYIEVKIIDDYDTFWMGEFLGVQVRGTGGIGNSRGCRAIRFEQRVLVVEAISEAGNEAWGKTAKKISRILESSG